MTTISQVRCKACVAESLGPPYPTPPPLHVDGCPYAPPTPASPEPVATCHDCGLRKCEGFGCQIPGDHCERERGSLGQNACALRAITRLRSELADSNAKLRAIAAALYGRDLSEPFIYDSDALAADVAGLRAMLEAERAVVNAAVARHELSSGNRPPFAEACIELARSVEALLALRKDQTDGD